MKRKERKTMVETITLILSAVSLIIGTAAITRLVLDSRYESKETELNNIIAAKERMNQLQAIIISDQNGTIRSFEALVAAQKEAELEKDKEIEQLGSVITRLRTAPCNSKERIPPGNTDWFALEPYTAINLPDSEQLRLQQECTTGLATGIRIYTDDSGNDYYCAALGSAYGRDIGDTWAVTLDNGEDFNIIYADYKDDGKTEFFGHPCENKREKPCTCVIEFIVDWNMLPAEVRERGSMSERSWCDGNIVKMEYTGRKWEP